MTYRETWALLHAVRYVLGVVLESREPAESAAHGNLIGLMGKLAGEIDRGLAKNPLQERESDDGEGTQN